MKKVFSISLAAFAVLLTASSCNESLPPRITPESVFAGTAEAKYTIDATQNAIRVSLLVTNVFDETIQDTLSLDGKLEIVYARDLTLVRTVRLQAKDILTTGMYNPSTRLMTIDPHATALLAWTWDFMADDSTDVRQRFIYHVDTSCAFRLIASSEMVAVRGAIRLTRQTPEFIIAPVTLRFCYVTDFVDRLVCPIPHTECD